MGRQIQKRPTARFRAGSMGRLLILGLAGLVLLQTIDKQAGAHAGQALRPTRMDLVDDAGQLGWGLGAAQSEQSPGRQRSELAAEIAHQREEAARLGRSPGSLDHFRLLEERVQEEGVLPVIVRVRAGFQPEVRFRRQVEVEAQRHIIAEGQQEILASLVGYDPVSVKRFRYLPYLVVRINRTGLAALRDSLEVLDVQEDWAMPMMGLAQSTHLIGATQLASTGVTGIGQTVAILDSGVDKTHPFLTGKVVAEACFSTNASAQSVSSLCPGGVTSLVGPDAGRPCSLVGGSCEHGTHVAGIIAGKGSTFSGVAPEAKLIAIQIFSQLNSATMCGPNRTSCIVSFTSDIIYALEEVYSLRNLHSIAAVNLSLGAGRYRASCDREEEPLKAAIDQLQEAGIATVVSSGNNGYTDSLSSPACISSSISVGATSPTTDQVSSFSNTASFLDLLAPGVGITSSVPGGTYQTMSGTSMAAPHVAGAWALARQVVPTASVTQIREALTTSGVMVTDTRVAISKPRVQIDAAIGRLSSGASTVRTPAPPQLLTATVVSASQIDLVWNDRSTNETGFRIRRKGPTAGSWLTMATLGPNQTSWSNARLVAGATYSYQVVAFNEFGESAPSNEVTATTTAPPPTAPSQLTAMAITGDQVELAWRDNSSNEQGFLVQRQAAEERSWGLIATVGQNGLTYRDSGLAAGATYRYRVLAYNGVGTSLPSNEASVTLQTLPQAPTELSARLVTTTQVELSWRDNATNESGFTLERKTGIAGSWGEVTRLSPNTTRYINRGLRAGTVYFYRIRAFNAVGSSAWSLEVTPTPVATGGGASVQPLLGAPSSLQVTALSVDRVALAWLDNSSQEVQVVVQRRTEAETAWKEVALLPADTTAYQEQGLVKGGLYFYRVLALDAAGGLAASNPATVRMPTIPFRVLANGELHQAAVMRGDGLYFRIYIPEGTSQLLVQTRGSGDVDLYLASGTQPSQSNFVCRSVSFTAQEQCLIPSPAVGDWHLLVYGYGTGRSSFLLTASHAGGTSLFPFGNASSPARAQILGGTGAFDEAESALVPR
jgi:subtilisin family serine protease